MSIGTTNEFYFFRYYVIAKDIFKMVYFMVFATGLFVCTATGFAIFSVSILQLNLKFKCLFYIRNMI